MILSYYIKFMRNTFLNSLKISSLDCKLTRTGFYNTSRISSTSDQDFTCYCNRSNRIFLPRKYKRFCVFYVYEVLSPPSLFLISCRVTVFAIYGLNHNNYRFSLVDASMKCSELAIHGVLRFCGYAENLWWK